jgi:hypothetical protein
VRTTIEIDERLIHRVMRITGLCTKRPPLRPACDCWPKHILKAPSATSRKKWTGQSTRVGHAGHEPHPQKRCVDGTAEAAEFPRLPVTPGTLP